MKRFCVLLTTGFVLSFVIAFATYGAEIIERSSIPVDEGLSDRSLDTYVFPEGVVIVKLTPPEGVTFSDDNDWAAGLYYYSITRLGFPDVPFNYVVTWKGSIYKMKSGATGVGPIVSWEDSDVPRSVLVAYFDNNREVTNSGLEGLTEITSRILSHNELTGKDIHGADLHLKRQGGVIQTSQLVLKKSSSTDLNSLINQVRQGLNIQPVSWNMKGTVINLEYPKSVDAGKNFVVRVEIKNESDLPWYNSGSRRVIIGTSEPRDRESKFFVSDNWASFTRVVSPSEEWVLPGDTAEFEFEVNIPLIPGKHSESFELLSLPDRWISGTRFKIEFEVKAGDFDLIEVRETDTGYLNVRECPSTGCKEIGKVVPGDILINLGKEGAWYKVRLDNGKEGWVYARYIKEL